MKFSSGQLKWLSGFYNPGQTCWEISMQFSILCHATIMSQRNKFTPLPTPGAMLFWPYSSSVHFLCYRKQHCNRETRKRSFKLQQWAFLSGWVQKIGIFVICLNRVCPRLSRGVFLHSLTVMSITTSHCHFFRWNAWNLLFLNTVFSFFWND